MNRDDDEQLWDLLGEAARPPVVSPFFARNVLRQVRVQNRGFPRLWSGWRRLIPVSGIVAATAAIFMAYTFSFRPAPGSDDDAIARIDVQDYEVVADLDDLLAADESSLWDENSTL